MLELLVTFAIIALVVLLLALLLPATPKGQEGEHLIDGNLRQNLDPRVYYVLEDITLPTRDGTTQIDHIVVSPFGVFVIETKNMSGWIFGKPGDKTWTKVWFEQKLVFQNPLRQNFKHVRRVQELFGLTSFEVHNVVVFVGDSTFKTLMPEQVVNSSVGLLNYIVAREKPLLSDDKIRAVIAGLETTRLPQGYKTDQAHINHLIDKF